MELYFIRHGQSENNAYWGLEDYQADPDPELTENGFHQARITANYLARNQNNKKENNWKNQNQTGFDITHIYTSLMERSVSTSYPIAKALGLPLVAWRDLHETGGIFSRTDGQVRAGLPGKKRSYFESKFPELILPEWLDENGWWNRPFEEKEERKPRAERVWEELLNRHGDKPGRLEDRVALVSHGGFYNYLLTTALGVQMERTQENVHKFWFIMNNCGISRIDVIDEQVLVAYTNRISHLSDQLIT